MTWIKHFSYIVQNINDKSIENAIMNNNFDIYQLEKKLNGLLEQLYGIGFNIVYIISRDNNYELQFDDKFLNIYSIECPKGGVATSWRRAAKKRWHLSLLEISKLFTNCVAKYAVPIECSNLVTFEDEYKNKELIFDNLTSLSLWSSTL